MRAAATGMATLWTIASAFIACSADDSSGEGGSTQGPDESGSTATGSSGRDDDDGDDGGSQPTMASEFTTGTSGDTSAGSTGPVADDTTAGGDPGRYLLTVDTGASPPALVRIDLDAMTTELRCTFPAGYAYSLAFARDGTLYGAHASQARVDTINPCNCGFQPVGPTSAGPLVLALGDDDDLRAIEPGLDAFSHVDVDTGLATVIGGLGLDFVGTGAAWSDGLAAVIAVDDGTDRLYAIDGVTGLAGSPVDLSEDVSAPGLAVHPDGTHWICSGDTLYALDARSGAASVATTLDLSGACTNLTAPQTAIACLD